MSAAPRRRGRPVALVLALGIATGTALLWRAREAPAPASAVREPDAGVRREPGPGRLVTDAPRAGYLMVVATPSGAEVWIDGALQELRAPNAYSLSAERAHRVELRLEGYAPFVREGVAVDPQGPVTLQVHLEPLRAALVVETEPSGAAVQLLGKTLGVTPLRTEIALLELARLGPGAPLTLSKPGYRTESIERVAHEPGQPIRIRHELQRQGRPAPEKTVGTVRIHVDKTWADVYLGDRLVGRVPEELLLPVGKHKLRLHNPVTQRTWHLDVSVARDKPSYYRVPE